jgi:hypothetical protein
MYESGYRIKLAMLKKWAEMRPCAYLLPPKQRTIARFMNFSGVVDWASNMLRVFSQLQENEQVFFVFYYNMFF